MGQVIDLGKAREDLYGKPAQISISLKRLARENRRELLRSYSYIRFWLSNIELRHYVHLLQLHLALREQIEANFKVMGERFEVVNQFDDHQKSFGLSDFVLPENFRAELIRKDLTAMGIDLTYSLPVTGKLHELIAYINRAAEVYSVSQLGILFMLEENIASAGPRLAAVVRENCIIDSRCLNYLNSFDNNRSELWRYCSSLDAITDFQTQANVVIAATITYELHRELLNPRDIRRNLSSSNDCILM